MRSRGMKESRVAAEGLVMLADETRRGMEGYIRVGGMTRWREVRVAVEDSGSVGWFAWRDCAAVEAARFSVGERGIAMRRFSVAAALAHGFLRRSDSFLIRAETVG